MFSDGRQTYQASEHIFSDGFSEYKPYFSDGDSLPVEITTAGILTADKTSVQFCIPLSKPVLGYLEADVDTENSEGFILCQNNKYTHGSDGVSQLYVCPGEYKVSIVDGMGVKICANNFSDLTNAIDNSPIGIVWKGIIVFSLEEAILDSARLDYMELG